MAVGFLDGDGGHVDINGDEYSVRFGDYDSYPFLAHPTLTDNKIIIGPERGIHFTMLEDLLNEREEGEKLINILHQCTVAGRYWIRDNGEIFIFSLWRERENMSGYSDRILYDLLNQTGLNPKIIIYGDDKVGVREITHNNDILSPVQRKLSNNSTPEAKYRFYRYVDENKEINKNSNMKKKLNEDSLRRIIRKALMEMADYNIDAAYHGPEGNRSQYYPNEGGSDAVYDYDTPGSLSLQAQGVSDELGPDEQEVYKNWGRDPMFRSVVPQGNINESIKEMGDTNRGQFMLGRVAARQKKKGDNANGTFDYANKENNDDSIKKSAFFNGYHSSDCNKENGYNQFKEIDNNITDFNKRKAEYDRRISESIKRNVRKVLKGIKNNGGTF